MGVAKLETQNLHLNNDDLQIVVIDNFYDMAISRRDCDWLGKLFSFKVNSFLASYPYGMLSFGAPDLIGTHWLLCKKKAGELVPVMGIKTIDSGRTNAFRMPFPGLEPVADPTLTAHQEAVNFELKRGQEQGYPVGYVGSWVVDPSVKEDERLSKVCKKMSSALISQWITEFDIQVAIAFASLRFHVEKFHAYLGVTRLTTPNGERLPDFTMRSAFDEKLCASVFYRKNHTKEAIADMNDAKNLWDRRITIASEHSPLFIQNSALKAA